MKSLGRVIFFNEHGTFVGKRGSVLSIKMRDGQTHEVPMGTLDAIVISGNCSISSALLAELSLFDVVCIFLDWSGRVQAKIDGRKGKNIFLRKHQLKACQDPIFLLEMSKFIVIEKMKSQEAVFPDLNFYKYISDVKEADNYQQILGYEGIASKEYFDSLRKELKARGFQFYKRDFYPSTDPSNVLLSIAYSMLTVEMSIYSNLFDFDEGWGFLHKDYYGRDSLLCDLIEPFRAPIADQYVLTSIDRLGLVEDDFKHVNGKLIIESEEKRKSVFKIFRNEYMTDGMRQDMLGWVRSVYDKIISKAIEMSVAA